MFKRHNLSVAWICKKPFKCSIGFDILANQIQIVRWRIELTLKTTVSMKDHLWNFQKLSIKCSLKMFFSSSVWNFQGNIWWILIDISLGVWYIVSNTGASSFGNGPCVGSEPSIYRRHRFTKQYHHVIAELIKENPFKMSRDRSFRKFWKSNDHNLRNSVKNHIFWLSSDEK